MDIPDAREVHLFWTWSAGHTLLGGFRSAASGTQRTFRGTNTQRELSDGKKKGNGNGNGAGNIPLWWMGISFFIYYSSLSTCPDDWISLYLPSLPPGSLLLYSFFFFCWVPFISTFVSVLGTILSTF